MEVYMLLNYYANIIYTLAVLIKVKLDKKQNFTKTNKNMLNPIPYVQI